MSNRQDLKQKVTVSISKQLSDGLEMLKRKKKVGSKSHAVEMACWEYYAGLFEKNGIKLP